MLGVLVTPGLLSAFLMGTPAWAAPPKTLEIGNWSISAHTDERSRRVDYCSASLTGASGVTLIYTLNTQFAWGLGFSNPSWSFTRGDTFNLTLKFAAQEAVRQRATAVDGQVMELLPDDRVALFEKIRRRSQLLVTAGGLSFAFELSGNSEALAALLQCVAPPKPPARNVKLVNPLVVQCALPQCTAAADSERRGEAAQFAADLTGRIGIYGVQVVGGNESPQLRADALWKAGPLTGAVSIVGGKMDEVAGKVLASDAQACRDDFFAGTAAEAIEGVRAMRILTSCAAAQVTSIYYLVIPRPQGGLYLLATMSSSVERFNSPPPPAQEVDGAIRATVVKVLSK